MKEYTNRKQVQNLTDRQTDKQTDRITVTWHLHLLYTLFTQFTLNSRMWSWWTLFLHRVYMLHVKPC